MIKFFEICVNKYSAEHTFNVFWPASIDNPKDNAVMFITEGNMNKVSNFSKASNCLVYWPNNIEIPEAIINSHVFMKCNNPHLEFCRFFHTNTITNKPLLCEYRILNGAFISVHAKIGSNTVLFPGVYIDSNVVIGDSVFIGSGTKILGNVRIGDNVVIRENTVIGADGLTTDRDENGKAISMPQFGGIIIENNVEIGANTVIARAAIDNTIIQSGSKIDNCCFISHNVNIGEDTFIVGETIMFGSSSTGKQVYISGNSTIRNGIHIGDRAVIGMGSVVTKSVQDGCTVMGNPAKEHQ